MPRSAKVSPMDSYDGDSIEGSEVDGEQKGLALTCNRGVKKALGEGLEFPEHLVEMIIARIPFPTVFKARCLSRSWYFNFPLPSSSVRSFSPPFPKQIASVSHRWPIFCPVYMKEDMNKILGFERGTGQWRLVMSLSYLEAGSWLPCLPMTSYGPLICANTHRVNDGYDVIVTNVITKCWKKLHEDETGFAGFTRILPLGEDGYRVFLLCSPDDDEIDDDETKVVWTRIYHSKLKTWTEVKKTVLGFEWRFLDNSAFLDEKIYFICKRDIRKPLKILMYDLGDNTWTAIPHHFDSRSIINAAVLGCGTRS